MFDKTDCQSIAAKASAKKKNHFSRLHAGSIVET